MHIDSPVAASSGIPAKVSGYVIRISLIAALGGFLFGFETAVISGAEKTIQSFGIYRRAGRVLQSPPVL